MDKLNKQQLSGIAELVHYINDRDVIQCILEKLGKENWTRDIFSNCADCLTLEQEEIYEQMGGVDILPKRYTKFSMTMT